MSRLLHFDAGEGRPACRRRPSGLQATGSVRDFFAAANQCPRCAMSWPLAKAVKAAAGPFAALGEKE